MSMSLHSIGFIGLGNMAGAVIRGLRTSNEFFETPILGCDHNQDKRDYFSATLGVTVLEDELAVAEQSQVLVLAIKPRGFEALLQKLSPALTGEQQPVSLAAGLSINQLSEYLGKPYPLVRAMPNINARVQASLTALSACPMVTPEQKELVSAIFQAVGSVQWINEDKLAAYSAISGAGPAFAFAFIDALSTAGIRAGLSRELAQQAACRMLEGSAALAARTKEHPRALIDLVTSPGGTTIEGMHALAKHGFEHAVQEAVQAVINKDKALK